MADELNLQVQASLSGIHIANGAVARWLEQRNAPQHIDYLAHLAVEELVTNCIKYGYEDTLEHMIEIRLQISGNELLLTVSDDARAFNPLDLPAPDTDLPLEE